MLGELQLLKKRCTLNQIGHKSSLLNEIPRGPSSHINSLVKSDQNIQHTHFWCIHFYVLSNTHYGKPISWLQSPLRRTTLSRLVCQFSNNVLSSQMKVFRFYPLLTIGFCSGIGVHHAAIAVRNNVYFLLLLSVSRLDTIGGKVS